MDIYTLECDTEDVVLFQGCLYKSAREVPDELKDVLDKETFEKARLYQIDKREFGFWSGLYSQFETTVRNIFSK